MIVESCRHISNIVSILNNAIVFLEALYLCIEVFSGA